MVEFSRYQKEPWNFTVINWYGGYLQCIREVFPGISNEELFKLEQEKELFYHDLRGKRKARREMERQKAKEQGYEITSDLCIVFKIRMRDGE